MIEEILIRLLWYAIGFMCGAVVLAIFASAGRRGLEERMANMRICSKRQDNVIRRRDNTIRLKQCDIEELEKELRRQKRRRGG